MTDSISYTMVMNVSCIWDRVKSQHKNYEEVLGAAIFCRLFEEDPSIQTFFEFGKIDSAITKTTTEIIRHPRFAQHARMVIDMIDCIISLLGPDLETLSEHLLAMGRRHYSYGVDKEDIEAMALAVMGALGEVMGEDELSENDRKDWESIFDIISGMMIEGVKQAKEEV